MTLLCLRVTHTNLGDGKNEPSNSNIAQTALSAFSRQSHGEV